MYMTPGTLAGPTWKRDGGQCLLSDNLGASPEIISGYGPGDVLCFQGSAEGQENGGEQ